MAIEDIETASCPESEAAAGRAIVKYLLAGDRGHYSPIEQATISFNVGYFPHGLMQQIRTHRVGVSFSAQSMRYTGDRILKAHDKIGIFDPSNKLHIEDIEKLFYIRPAGHYSNRQGKKYYVSESDRIDDIEACWEAICRYRYRIKQGWAEEHARSMLPFDYRQHFVLGCNARSLMHLLDLRWKKDAQIECQKLCEMLFEHFKAWCPDIADWYYQSRYLKGGKLAP